MTHILTQIHMCTHTRACMHIGVQTYVGTHAHIHTCTHTSLQLQKVKFRKIFCYKVPVRCFREVADTQRQRKKSSGQGGFRLQKHKPSCPALQREGAEQKPAALTWLLLTFPLPFPLNTGSGLGLIFPSSRKPVCNASSQLLVPSAVT